MELNEIFLSLGQSKADLQFVIEENAEHNEIAWAKIVSLHLSNGLQIKKLGF